MKAVTVLHGLIVKLGKSKNGVELWCRQIAGEGAHVKRNKIIIRNLPFKVLPSELEVCK